MSLTVLLWVKENNLLYGSITLLVRASYLGQQESQERLLGEVDFHYLLATLAICNCLM